MMTVVLAGLLDVDVPFKRRIGIHWVGPFLLAMAEKMAPEKSLRKDFYTCGRQRGTHRKARSKLGKWGPFQFA